MSARRLFLATAACLMMASPVLAVTQIEDISWGPVPPGISTSGTTLSVNFIAHATATDIASGVTFSLQERDPDGNDMLLDVVLPWSAPYPSEGTELSVTTSLRVRCSGGSLVGASVGQWYVTWCDAELGPQSRRVASGTARSTGTSEPESFELVLVDENGIEAPGGTPEDVYTCSAIAVAESEPAFTSPWELAHQGLSIASETGWFPRSRNTIENAGTIQIAFDPAGQQRCGQIPAQSFATLYVVAMPQGPALCGITGAELRIVGIPSDWVASASPAGASVGDPLSATGGNVVFSTCQSPASGPVLLYTILVVATSTVTDQFIEVIARTPPANPNFNCPLVTLCDVPFFSIVCASGSKIRINPPADTACDRTLSVEADTWSRVKGLYR